MLAGPVRPTEQELVLEMTRAIIPHRDVDISRDGWRARAACAGSATPQDWDVDPNRPTPGNGRAATVCRTVCPVPVECLTAAVRERAHGVIRGGRRLSGLGEVLDDVRSLPAGRACSPHVFQPGRVAAPTSRPGTSGHDQPTRGART